MFAKHPSATKTFGKVPRFEWDGLVPRFKDTEPAFRKPPNIYNVPDPNSLEALMKRVVSIKGPYNLFTGKRDGTSIKNHFSPPYTIVPDRYHLEPSDLDIMLTHPMKARWGPLRIQSKYKEYKSSSNAKICFTGMENFCKKKDFPRSQPRECSLQTLLCAIRIQMNQGLVITTYRGSSGEEYRRFCTFRLNNVEFFMYPVSNIRMKWSILLDLRT